MTLGEVNVLVGAANWAWPEAVREVFMPRSVNSLVAADANDALDIIEHRRIHAAVLDMDCEKLNGLSTIKIIRTHHPLLPCILLARMAEQELLSRALQLNVFSVVAKPVDMQVLLEQLDRLFRKRYNEKVFGRFQTESETFDTLDDNYVV